MSRSMHKLIKLTINYRISKLHFTRDYSREAVNVDFNQVGLSVYYTEVLHHIYEMSKYYCIH